MEATPSTVARDDAGRGFPDAVAWRRFLDRLLLWSATLALAAALVFFVAYNWEALGKPARFAAVQALVAAGALAYWKLGPQSAYGKAALLFASIALGGLLALFGQTYQTGADTWELFASWAALMAPWVLLGGLAALWILWLAVINAAIVLYYGTFFGGQAQLWSLLLANALALAAWELGARRFSWLRERWAPRLIALAAGGAATGLALQAIFDRDEAGAAQGLAYAVFLALVLTVYRVLVKDLFILAAACLSLMVVTAALLAEGLGEGRHGAFVWLLIAVVVLAMGAASAWWLRRVAGEA